MRIGLDESPVFTEALRARTARRMPILDVLRHDATTVLLAAGSSIGISTLGYIVIVYFVTYATRQLSLPLTTTLGLLLTAAVLFAVSIVVFAHWSDRFGRRRIMQWGCAALTLWSLAFFPLADTGSVPPVALALGGILIIQGAYIGPQPAVFAELFPTATRYSGVSLSLTLGTILGGAVAPAIATALFNAAGTSRLITVYITSMSAISWPSRWRSGDIARSWADTMNQAFFSFHAGLLMAPKADANDHGACVAKGTSFSTADRSCAKSRRMPLRVSVKPNASWTSSSPIGVA
jgi:MFS family permease